MAISLARYNFFISLELLKTLVAKGMKYIVLCPGSRSGPLALAAASISKKKELCRLYIESLYWTINYYINGCIAWRWYNPYNIAPFLSDIYKYLLTINTISINKDNIPYKPDEQLKIVLPPSSFSLIKDKPKLPHYYYPIDFKEEYILKRYEWESYPLIPN